MEKNCFVQACILPLVTLSKYQVPKLVALMVSEFASDDYALFHHFKSK